MADKEGRWYEYWFHFLVYLSGNKISFWIIFIQFCQRSKHFARRMVEKSVESFSSALFKMLQLVLMIHLDRTGVSQPHLFFILQLQRYLGKSVEYVLLSPVLRTD